MTMTEGSDTPVDHVECLFYLVFTALFYRWALAHPHEAPDEIAAQ
jgi:hypothetical protein